MTAAEIKMIIDIVSNLSGNTIQALWIFFGLKVILQILSLAFGLAIAIIIAKAVIKIVNKITTADRRSRELQLLRNAMRIGTSGYVTEEEFDQMIDWVKEKRS